MPATAAAPADGDWLSQFLLGTLSQGVNHPTFVILNVALFLAVLSLIALLAISVQTSPELLPHVAVLIVLACSLWGLIIWFVGTVGLTDAQKQQEQQGQQQEEGEEQAPEAAATPEVKDSTPASVSRRTRQARKLA